jgi:hypothetical protein
MNSFYDHLSPKDQRLVARWRAMAIAGAIAVLFAVVAVITVLQPGDLPPTATQAAATRAN